MDTKQVVARFESERQALALMDHPAIAKVFDGGSTPEGRPVLRHGVRAGRSRSPSTATPTGSRPPSGSQLFIEVCEGVQHAHQKAIIHRDLKPSNILVSLVDGKAQAEDHRLRDRQGDGQPAHRQDALHRAGRDHRHPRVHEPGAGGLHRAGHRHPDRRLLAGRRALPAPHRRAALRFAGPPLLQLRGAAPEAEGGRAAPAQHQARARWATRAARLPREAGTPTRERSGTSSRETSTPSP